MFRQRGRLRLRLQVGLLGHPLRKRCEADAATAAVVCAALKCATALSLLLYVLTRRRNAVHHGDGEELLSVLQARLHFLPVLLRSGMEAEHHGQKHLCVRRYVPLFYPAYWRI